MISPIKNSLSKSIINNIELDKIIYCELAEPGAMGKPGYIMIYIKDDSNMELICYETNIWKDEETYILTWNKMFKYSDKEGDNKKSKVYFSSYFDGLGNHNFVNKKVNLFIREDYFLFKKRGLEFQITPSSIMFYTVVKQTVSSKIKDNSIIKRISPKWINNLEDNEIYVFSSNLEGIHYGGTAAIAKKWGAIHGQGVGPQGQTYAIPTMQGGIETIKPYVNDFLNFAKSNPNLKFLVTEIGCSLADFEVREIAPLFWRVVYENIENVFLPESFYKVSIEI